MWMINALSIAGPTTALMTVSAVAQTYGDHPHMGAWGWGGMILGPIMMIVLIALIVGAVVLVLRWMGLGGSPAARGEKNARDILDERFARGEIDKDEYEDRRQVLSKLPVVNSTGVSGDSCRTAHPTLRATVGSLGRRPSKGWQMGNFSPRARAPDDRAPQHPQRRER